MNCPYCDDSDVRLSERFDWWFVFHRAFGQKAYRCRKCKQRFFSSEDLALPEGHPKRGRTPAKSAKSMTALQRKKRRQRIIITIAVFAAMFFFFWLFLRFLMMERKDSGELRNEALTTAARIAA
jgi:hypothetical protein